MLIRVVAVVLLVPTLARAGLYYSGETLADLPSRWGGFLLDHRALLNVARTPTRDNPASPLRVRYQQEADRLAKKETLTPDEAADLGALHLRLGNPTKAIAVLRPAQRANPTHFRLAANLGTAWQQAGDLTQAAAALELAVHLAPGKHLAAEKLHLKLVRLRAREKAVGLDDLFGVRYSDPDGVKKLPSAAIALTQQLSLWLPHDPRLLWQLGELAAAAGDPVTAAAFFDGCVTEFELRQPDLLARRKAARAAADEAKRATKKDHEGHAWLFKPRSSRPLVSKAGLAALPPIDPKGVTPLAWEVIAETTVDRRARPTFHRYLKELDGKLVTLRGHMQPLGGDTDLSAFMLIESPVGCWYCESPEIINIVLVELPAGRSGRYTRAAVKITGRLVLNAKDPEQFLYLVQDAKVEDAAGE